MPAITILAEQLTLDGRAPLTDTGTLSFRAIPSPLNDTAIVSRNRVTVPVVAGQGEVTLDPLPAGWAYDVTVSIGGGSYAECVIVLDGDEYYHLLQRVDRSTLAPVEASPAWTVALGNESEVREAAVAAIDGRVDTLETTQATLATTASLAAHTGNTSNPHAVTKAQVGLSNVDNTADASKPVSTAQAAADTAVATAAATDASSKANPATGSDNWLKLHAGGNLDALIVGTITRDSNGAATSAPVVWPDGTAGTYTATTVSTAFPGAVDAFTVTYGSPVTKTVTQSAVTRSASGAVTTRPAMSVA